MRNRLKLLRAARDWSQGDLAGRLGVSRQTVNAVETGRYDPSLPLAFRLATLFGTPIETIFFPDGPADGPADARPPAPDGEARPPVTGARSGSSGWR